MLRRLSIRGKILAVLAVPVLVLVMFAAFISGQAINDVREARAVSEALGSIQTIRVFAEALQQERAAAVLHSGEKYLERQLRAGEVTETDQQRRERPDRAAERSETYEKAVEATDGTLRRVRDRVAEIDFDVLDPLIRQSFLGMLESTSQIEQARGAVERGDVTPNIIDGTYTSVVREARTLAERLGDAISNRALGVYLSAFSQVDIALENIVNERDFGFYALERLGDDASANLHLRRMFPDTLTAHTRARDAVAALGVEDLAVPGLGASFDGFANWQAQRTNIESSDSGLASVRANSWYEKATIEAEAIEPTLSALWSEAETIARETQAAELREATLNIVGLVAAFALSVVLALLIARTIVVPVERLTEAAAEVRDQLPKLVEQVATPGEGPELTLAQIPVNSNDELGRLAQAFNEVNQKTIEVAQEQAALRGSIAEMFVNVARRDQVLLNRQLSFIDSLEREEEDPNTLANLFRLDHLATRMRRNAESLLVLAGIDSGRRVRGSMSLSDVIRTASSEIEQYDRINLILGPDPQMHGFNALPAAHLLAELLENATVFSEPGTPVDVTTEAEIEFITVAITDRGLGMSDEEIERANQRIRQTSATEVIGAQRLGLHVVGRLASRLGTKVVFAKAEGESGTQVRVRFPRLLFVDDARDAQPESGGRLLTAEEIAAQAAAPEVVPVDLEALTDGTTEQGLPRRRVSEPTAPVAPVAPAPAAPAAPAASAEPARTDSGLPKREPSFVLPEAPRPTLVPEVAAAADYGWMPKAEVPASKPLPSRARRSADGQGDQQQAQQRPPAASLDPAARSGMFAGFRRGAEAVQAAREAQQSQDGAPAPEQAVAEQPASQQPVAEQSVPEQAAPATEQPFVVPSLEPDEPPAPPVVPSQEAAPLPTRTSWRRDVETPALAPEETPALAPEEPPAWSAQQPVAEQAAPAVEQPAQPVAEQPAEEAPAWAPQAPAWQPEQSWQQAAEQPTWASQAPSAEPGGPWSQQAQDAWSPAAQDAAPNAWSPEPPAPEQPSWSAPSPVEQQSAWSPAEEPTWQQPESPAWQPTTSEQPAAWQQPETPAWQWQSADAQAQQPEAPQTQYPAFSPEGGYSAPATWSAAPAWSGTSEASASTPVPSAGTPAPAASVGTPAVSAASPATAEAPAPFGAAPTPATGTPLPSFSELVGPAPVEQAPSRRERRQSSGKPSRAERKAEKLAAKREKAEQKALAKAAKKRKGKAAPEPTPQEPPKPAVPGFLSQPTAIAALRSAASPASPAASTPEPAAEPAAPVVSPAPAASPAPAWSGSWSPEPAAPAAPAQPAPQAEPAQPEPVGTGATFTPAGPAPTAGATFTPAPAAAWSPGGPAGGAPRQFGVLDDEVAAMLALRSDIQEQALSELSQLSAYRPKVVKPAGSALTKRTPTAIPTAPELSEESDGKPRERDPEALRSRLSSFQSGASRGRRAGRAAATDSAPTPTGAAPMANGSTEHANPDASGSTKEAPTW